MHIRAFHDYPSRRSPVLADNVVATSHPLAAQAGLQMLAKGGNAVDAALAAAITLPLVEPTGNGLGSDAFAILWDGSELHGLNASGRSPAAWSPDRFAGHEKMPFRGWDTVTVPGAVSGWVALSDRFGALPFADLCEPAFRYATDGYTVTPKIAALWKRAETEIADQPGFAQAFLPGGKAPVAGDRFASPDMARTLQLIAETKGAAFYQGELAAKIDAFAKEHGAALRDSDLHDHAPDWCGTLAQPVALGASLHEIPPNGQGIAAQMALGMLAHTDLDGLDVDDPRAMHLQIEAMKLALRDTEHYVADPTSMDHVTAQDLLNPTYLAQRAALITDTAQNFGLGAPKNGGTVNLTAADASGMMVSFIQSNYAGFGSGVVVPGTGISLQNRGAGFSLDPTNQNAVAGGKRPFHTIIPGFLMGPEHPLMSFGVMGGPMQAQGHVQMVHRILMNGQDPQMAIDAPRWRVTEGLGVACESALPIATRDALENMGHQITLEAPNAAFGFGGAQAIWRQDNGSYIAGSDSRKDGAAVGF
ncbi:MAG: gamma-glutamyltransferase family protein [Rhodobacteraceae bacterium]|nr:gamma-glutamyltransferase family protein [Paracoccaceae bacterium]